MKFLLALIIVLASPGFAQTQYTSQTVDWGFTAPGAASLYQVAGTYNSYPAPLVPGQITDLSINYTIEFTGTARTTNAFSAVPRFARWGLYARTWMSENNFHGHGAGIAIDQGGHPGWNLDTPVMQPGETVHTPYQVTTTVDVPFDSDFLWGVPQTIRVGLSEIAPNNLAPWNFCDPTDPDPLNCWDIWSDPIFAAWENVTVQITGSITWEWEPELASVLEICTGDGFQSIALVGDWESGVRAFSSSTGQFTMLFLGDYHSFPGSSFCIGTGQRISESLAFDEIDFAFPATMLLTGQTYTLQAVHRFSGGVRFSNALLFQPL